MRRVLWGPRIWTLAACVVAVSACATLQDMSKELPRATKPVKYKMVGANVELRKNLERGVTQLQGENYQAAVRSLNRALWELERVESRWLRLEDLSEAHQALSDAYSGLRKPTWSEEHRTLSRALGERMGRKPGTEWPERSLTKAKEAYAKAEFRDVVAILTEALVDLEEMAEASVRIRRLEEARCYLAFTHLALDDEVRAKEELERLWALDQTLAFCTREAPPRVRSLIQEVRQRRNTR